MTQQIRISGRPLGAVLRDLRVAKKLSIVDFSKMMHYASNTLRNYESGYGRMTRERFQEAVKILAPERMTELMAYFDIDRPERAEGFNGALNTKSRRNKTKTLKASVTPLNSERKYSSLTLTSIRKRRNFSQNHFAQALGISPSMVSLMESGKRRWSLAIAENIATWAETLGVPLSDKERSNLFDPPATFGKRRMKK